MLAGVRAIAAALAMVSVSFAAVARSFHLVRRSSRPATSRAGSASDSTPTQIQGQLANQNVVIATGTDPNTPGNGDIFVQSSIRWRTDNSLTLSACRNIDITTNGVKIVNDANGNLVLRADSTGRGQGTVVFENGAQVDYLNSAGTVSIFYNP